MELFAQIATWVGLGVLLATGAYGAATYNTSRIFNEGIKGLARSGGDISADAVIDIYAGAREKARSEFTSRDLVKIEKMYLWVVASIAAESDPKLQVPVERLKELQVTASELRTELRVLASPVSTTKIRR
ncbi:hypothetical protein [Roseateles sp.]|uniref:hypothetical protein n=1 Tax=Roseateles sp. TaxID=1971397 RepID=UPI003D0C44F3